MIRALLRGFRLRIFLFVFIPLFLPGLSQAAVSFTPFLSSPAGEAVLRSVPAGKELLRALGGQTGIEKLALRERAKLDQMLQEVYFRAMPEDRLAVELLDTGAMDSTIQLSSRFTSALERSLIRLRNESASTFFEVPPAQPRQAHLNYARSRDSFLSAQPRVQELDELLNASVGADDYSQAALRSLSPEGALFLARRKLPKKLSVLERLVQTQTLELPSGRAFQVQSRWMISQSTGPFVGRSLERQPEGVLSYLATARDQTTGQISGFFIVKFEPVPFGGRRWEPHLDLIKVDVDQVQARGLGGLLYEQLIHFVQSLGAPKLFLNADWSGRLVWAKKGFRFDSSYRPKLDGREVSQRELFQQNFLRFLNEYHIDIRELGIRTDASVIPLSRVEQLVEPRDFAQVVALDGRKVVADQYVDAWRAREQVESDVGVAFLLKPYFARVGQRHSVFQPDDSSFVADHAAPSWMGVLDLSPSRSEAFLRAE